MYAVFVRLTLSPCLSNWSRHISSSLSTAALDVLHRTRSSANSMAQGGSVDYIPDSINDGRLSTKSLLISSLCIPQFVY